MLLCGYDTVDLIAIGSDELIGDIHRGLVVGDGYRGQTGCNLLLVAIIELHREIRIGRVDSRRIFHRSHPHSDSTRLATIQLAAVISVGAIETDIEVFRIGGIVDRSEGRGDTVLHGAVEEEVTTDNHVIGDIGLGDGDRLCTRGDGNLLTRTSVKELHIVGSDGLAVLSI